MVNIIAALIFIITSIFTWISVCFKVLDTVWGEESLFKTKKVAIFVYAVSIGVSIFMTILGYINICIIQRYII